MSVYYAIYAEVRVGNTWYNISPLLRQSDGSVKVRPVICGQSWLGEAVHKMQENCYMLGRPTDLSEELRAVYSHDDGEKLEDFWSGMTYGEYYAHTLFVVNYGKHIKNKVKSNVPARYFGYVEKRIIAAHKIGDIEEIYSWCTPEEYAQLTEKQKKRYAYYEWNKLDDWYAVYSELVSAVDCLLSFFCEWCFDIIPGCSADDQSPSADYVRLIVEKS